MKETEPNLSGCWGDVFVGWACVGLRVLVMVVEWWFEFLVLWLVCVGVAFGSGR